jgi:hypothetical protein
LDNERKTSISDNVVFTAKASLDKHTGSIASNNENFGRVTSGEVVAVD